MRPLGLSPQLYAGLLMAGEVAHVTWPLLGAFIFLRRSGEWIGLLVSMVLIAAATNGLSDSVNVLAAQTPQFALLYDSLSAIGATLLILLLFLFPDGRFVPGWTRYLAIPLAFVALADPLFASFVPLIEGSSGTLVQLAVLLIGFPIGTWSQIQRYRKHSTFEQQQQTKWVLLGFVGMLLVILTTINRRFFRGDYDAAQTLETFGRSVRDEVDLASMQASLLGTVQDTMHPSHLSLWLRQGASGDHLAGKGR